MYLVLNRFFLSWRFTSTETLRLIRDGESRTAILTSHVRLNGVRLVAEFVYLVLNRFFLSWRFTSTETIRLIREGEPRTATSTFTLALNGLLLAVFMYRVHYSQARCELA